MERSTYLRTNFTIFGWYVKKLCSIYSDILSHKLSGIGVKSENEI